MTVNRSATIYFSGAPKSPGAYYIKEKLAMYTLHTNTSVVKRRNFLKRVICKNKDEKEEEEEKKKTQRGGIVLNLAIRM
jgi:hypothetical protein